MYNRVSIQIRGECGAGMDVSYCGQCRMMIAPQARYCSVCGSVVQPRRSWVRVVWPQFVWVFQRIVAIYVVWIALRVGIPLTIAVTPACAPAPALIGIASRQMGVIQPLTGVVGGEGLFVVRSCTPAPAWYVVFPAHPWFVALAQRDATAWQGWGLMVFDQGVRASEQALIYGFHTGVDAVRGFLFDTRTW